MKIIKKIMCWNNDLTNFENIMLLCYRVFTYIFPSGILLYDLVVAKLVDNEVSVATKLGCGGLFLLGVMILVAVIMLGRYFKKTIDGINDKLLDCTDAEQKEKLVQQKKKVRKWHEIYKNACLVAPFVIGLVLVNLMEHGLMTFRGTLMIIVCCLCAGFGFNTFAQNLISKNK